MSPGEYPTKGADGPSNSTEALNNELTGQLSHMSHEAPVRLFHSLCLGPVFLGASSLVSTHVRFACAVTVIVSTCI